MTLVPVGETADSSNGRVAVECESFQGFLESFSPLISEAGIFLPSETQRLVGECVEFSVGLGPDFPLLRGIGDVVWTVEPGDEAAERAGMAVRYLVLDPPTMVLVEKILERAQREGIESFPLEEPPESACTEPVETAEPMAPTAPMAPVVSFKAAAPVRAVPGADQPPVEPRPNAAFGGRLSWAATILVGLTLGAGGYWLQGALESLILDRGEREGEVVVAEQASTAGANTELRATAAAVDLTDREPSPPEEQPNRSPGEIEKIEWEVGPDSTLVVLHADAPWGADSYRLSRVEGGSPRELIKIPGVARPLEGRFEVGSVHVLRLRTGLHGDPGARELHVVADLAGPSIGIAAVETHGFRLELRFSDDWQ